MTLQLLMITVSLRLFELLFLLVALLNLFGAESLSTAVAILVVLVILAFDGAVELRRSCHRLRPDAAAMTLRFAVFLYCARSGSSGAHNSPRATPCHWQ